ncbi:hypothetical protein HAX54_042417, partial [Datura stramonium]|nr:hypothetical protein [Datura stramonium]
VESPKEDVFIPEDDQVRDEQVGPNQAPPRFIATPVLQETFAYFQTSSYGGTFQKVMDIAKDVEYMRRQEFGDARDKRYCTSSSYSGTSSGGRDFSAKSFHPPFGRPIQETIQSFEGGYFGWGYYNSGQGLQGYFQISSGHRGYSDHSRSNK